MSDFSLLENRFQQLLKQRLALEAENRPPLFPWETEIREYPREIDEDFSLSVVPPWLSQITLPVNFPPHILAQFVKTCSQFLDSCECTPQKIVKVVSQLFPDYYDFLQQQTNLLLLAGASRDLVTIRESLMGTESSLNYEDYSLEQQMTLSLLAVEQIFKTLIINLSPENPFRKQEWQTEGGMITLRADYLPTEQSIKVEIKLPQAGEIYWTNQGKSLCLDGNSSELISFYLTNVVPETIHSIEVTIWEPRETSFNFGLQLQEGV